MTEYDYSPAAYERYMAQQSRVSNWVHNQVHHEREYRSPFVPPTPAQPARKLSVRTDPRPQPSRAKTMPAVDVGSSSADVSRKTSRSSRSRGASRDARAPQRSATRSQTVPPNARYPAPAPAPLPAPAYYPHPQQQYRYPAPNPPPPPPQHQPRHMRHEPAPYLPHAGVPHIPTSVAPYVPDPPPGHNVVYRMYDPNTHKDIYLPAPRPGETYVVIPPKGRSIQVVDGTRSGSHSRSSSRSSARTPSSKKGQPLLRRLFNNFTPSIEWGPAPPDDRRPRTVSY